MNVDWLIILGFSSRCSSRSFWNTSVCPRLILWLYYVWPLVVCRKEGSSIKELVQIYVFEELLCFDFIIYWPVFIVFTTILVIVLFIHFNFQLIFFCSWVVLQILINQSFRLTDFSIILHNLRWKALFLFCIGWLFKW